MLFAIDWFVSEVLNFLSIFPEQTSIKAYLNQILWIKEDF